MSGWTDERIDRAKKLNADGCSASQIAKDLGGVSRNAVIGKLNRLGVTYLSGKSEKQVSSPSKPARERLTAPVVTAAPPPLERAPSLPVAAPPAPVLHVDGSLPRLTELGRCHCRWPIGDVPRGQGDEQRFCGKGFPDDGRDVPYCENHQRHSAAAHQPKPPTPYDPSVIRRAPRRDAAASAFGGWAA